MRQLRSQPREDRKRLRVAIAAGFTAAPLENYLIVEAARRGLLVEAWFAGYGQFETQCADAGSALYAWNPDVVVIAARLEDLAPELWHEWEGLAAGERERRAAEAAGRVAQAARQAAAIRGCPVVVWNFSEPAQALWGVRRSPAGMVEAANRRLDELAAEQAGVAVFDCARVALEQGLRQMYDARLDYVARMPFGVRGQMALASGLARLLRALYTAPAKCLVLDLDGTLWGGVLGEAGAGGIALGQDYPGRAYRDFQYALRGLRERGVLLAAASKNNEDEVRAVFAEHRDMVLRWEDFAATQVHWNDKAGSLRAIAEQLRIGLEAMAFYDDNPLEREWVRAAAPEVTVLEVPEDPLERVAALAACEIFDQARLSDEDRRRAGRYDDDRQREAARAESGSLTEFLATLGIRVTAGAVDAGTRARVAQLLQRTNQFNLTGRRYSEAEIQAQLEAGAIGCWLRAADRFGDYGLVGAAMAVPADTGAWRIDSFVMSCRILGRQVESALLAVMAQRARERGGERLIGEYIATARNRPARDFYAAHGFTEHGTEWVYELARGGPAAPAHIAVEAAPDAEVCRP